MDEKLKALNLANFLLGCTGYSICLVCSVSMLITIIRKKLKIQMITSLLIIQVSIALLAISMYSLLYSKTKTEKNYFKKLQRALSENSEIQSNK